MNKSTFPKIDENKDNKSVSEEKGRAAIVFTLKNEVGGLVKALKLFQVITFWQWFYVWIGHFVQESLNKVKHLASKKKNLQYRLQYLFKLFLNKMSYNPYLKINPFRYGQAYV